MSKSKTLRTCDRCGRRRPAIDMAIKISQRRGKMYLCHPGNATDPTCYMNEPNESMWTISNLLDVLFGPDGDPSDPAT